MQILGRINVHIPFVLMQYANNEDSIVGLDSFDIFNQTRLSRNTNFKSFQHRKLPEH
jgi:hypothetical protein